MTTGSPAAVRMSAATMSSSGWQTVVTATSSPRAVKRDSMRPFHKVKPLVDVVDVVRRYSVEPDDTEMQPVRIDPIPVRRIVLAARFVELYGVGFHAAASEIVVAQGFAVDEIAEIRKAVPAPLALRAERNAVAVSFGEGLQSRRIDRKGEFAVANRERGQRVEAFDYRIVSPDERFAVDGCLHLRACCQQQPCTYANQRFVHDVSCVGFRDIWNLVNIAFFSQKPAKSDVKTVAIKGRPARMRVFHRFNGLLRSAFQFYLAVSLTQRTE